MPAESAPPLSDLLRQSTDAELEPVRFLYKILSHSHEDLDARHPEGLFALLADRYHLSKSRAEELDPGGLAMLMIFLCEHDRATTLAARQRFLHGVAEARKVAGETGDPDERGAAVVREALQVFPEPHPPELMRALDELGRVQEEWTENELAVIRTYWRRWFPGEEFQGWDERSQQRCRDWLISEFHLSVSVAEVMDQGTIGKLMRLKWAHDNPPTEERRQEILRDIAEVRKPPNDAWCSRLYLAALVTFPSPTTDTRPPATILPQDQDGTTGDGSASVPTVEYLGLIVDREERKIRRTGREVTVELAGKKLPWALFLALLSQRGGICSRDRVRAVWPACKLQDNPPPGTMSQAVLNLRQLLEPLGVDIEPVRELGWRLVAGGAA